MAHAALGNYVLGEAVDVRHRPLQYRDLRAAFMAI
jgi:hypothetical protein